MQLRSYAKVNLTLEVSAARSDGYHDIDSVVQVIDIADELSVSRADTGTIEVEVDSREIPSGRENLVYRACEVFFQATGVRGGVRCAIAKRIPPQAGLGGGSGDAATAIAALNRLYECGLKPAELAELAAKVGSDAPLFVYGGTVRMRGRGEIIEPLPDAPPMSLVVVKPDVGVSTPWAYAELDRCARSRESGASDQAEEAVRRGDRRRLIDALWNDFDPVVAGRFPEIRRAKLMLVERGAETAMLAGSGAAVFGVFGSREDAAKAAERLSGEFPNIFLTRALNRDESAPTDGIR